MNHASAKAAHSADSAFTVTIIIIIGVFSPFLMLNEMLGIPLSPLRSQEKKKKHQKPNTKPQVQRQQHYSPQETLLLRRVSRWPNPLGKSFIATQKKTLGDASPNSRTPKLVFLLTLGSTTVGGGEKLVGDTRTSISLLLAWAPEGGRRFRFRMRRNEGGGLTQRSKAAVSILTGFWICSLWS